MKRVKCYNKFLGPSVRWDLRCATRGQAGSGTNQPSPIRRRLNDKEMKGKNYGDVHIISEFYGAGGAGHQGDSGEVGEIQGGGTKGRGNSKRGLLDDGGL